MPEIKVICGALVFDGDRFVLVKEAQPKAYGKWNCPAGHLEAGEDIVTAAKREVREETGLDISIEGLAGVYEHNANGDNVIIFLFRASAAGGALKYAEGELLDARWFTYGEFDALADGELRNRWFMRKALADSRHRDPAGLDAVSMDFGRRA